MENRKEDEWGVGLAGAFLLESQPNGDIDEELDELLRLFGAL